MQRPFIKLEFDPRSPLPLRPALSLYHKHRFAEAIAYLEDIRKSRRVSDSIFYFVMTFATGGAALPFLPWVMTSTYDPLFRLLGNCYFQLGDDDRAARCLKKIFDKQATDWAVTSLALRAIGRNNQADYARRQAIRANPELVDWLGKPEP